VLSNRIVEDVFGPSMHREVVARSACVLRFLSMMKALAPDHLDMIWRSCLNKNENELVEEIHAVLSNLLPHLSPDHSVFLLKVVKSVLRNMFDLLN
jgi:hypothetical protein